MSGDELRGGLGKEAWELAKLAAPVALGQLGFMFMGVADTVVAGQVSHTVLAAVSLGHLFSFSMLTFAMGLLRGLDPFFSQAHGAGDIEAGRRAFGRVLLISAVMFIPVALIHTIAGPILAGLGQPEDVVPLTATYCMVLIPGLLPTLFTAGISQFLQGLGKVNAPTIAVIVANVINVVLDIALVLGVDAIGLEGMGAFGAGLATTIVRFAMCGLLVVMTWRTLSEYMPSDWREVVRIKPMLDVLSHGLPVAVQACLEGWAFSALGLIMGALGSVELAAHAILINIVATTFMVPFGIGAATSVRVGHLVGARRSWSSAAWLGIGFAAGWMTLTSFLVYMFSEQVGDLYTNDAAVIAVLVAMVPAAAGMQVFDGIQAAAFGALRGAGDTRLPALANVVGYWVIGLPLGWYLGVYRQGGPSHVWIGVVLALAIIAVLLLLRVSYIMRRGAARVAG